MYKGTYEGDDEEIKFVQEFNSNKASFAKYLSNFGNSDTLWMVRVTTKQFSYLSDRKVFTRSDCYLAKISADISAILSDNEYYLSEEILDNNRISYEQVPYSGVSVKMANSDNFQILKTGPNSFKTLFGSFELGAGASLFCMREEELPKNIDLIRGWNSTPEKMAAFFGGFTSGSANFYMNQNACKNIKNYASSKIKKMIEDDKQLQLKIFNGITLYEEPYTALYFYHGKVIEQLTTIPFSVTTGSGRSKGEYTIVLKPIR